MAKRTGLALLLECQAPSATLSGLLPQTLRTVSKPQSGYAQDQLVVSSSYCWGTAKPSAQIIGLFLECQTLFPTLPALLAMHSQTLPTASKS